MRRHIFAAALAAIVSGCASTPSERQDDDLAAAVRAAQLGIDCPAFVAAPRGRPLESWSRVSSPFGHRRHPITGQWRMHSGIDLAAPEGRQVLAAATGRVAFAGERGGYGQLIVVAHACGFETRYAHLSDIDVAVGDVVPTGAHLGAVGETGRTTGPHLHYEIRLQGEPLNPGALL